MEEINKFFAQTDAGKVLDVATGAGNFIQFIKAFKSFSSVTAIDSNPKFKQVFDKHFASDNICFTEMNASKLNFADDSFDTVCISNSIHHLEKPEEILLEMQRVVKPDGKIIINEMISNDLNAAQKSHALLHHWTAEFDMLTGQHHKPTYTKTELTKIIEDALSAKVKCIEYTFPTKDVFDEKMMDYMYKTIDMFIERMKDKQLDNLIKKGHEIKDYITKNGYAPATSVLIHV